MIAIGIISSILMGWILGVIGGGGSILLVPILVYLFSISPILATSYSLVIVCGTAAFGAYNYKKIVNLDIKKILTFALASSITVSLTRGFLIPLLPDPIVKYPFYLSKNAGIMFLFALLMLLSSLMILFRNNKIGDGNAIVHSNIKIASYGAVIGIVTGILGAGGGFLIIPALILLLNLPMKVAVGSSLLIISVNSFIGFITDLFQGVQLNLYLLLLLFLCTVSGMKLAISTAHFFDEKKLKFFFAYFTILIAIIILIKEFSAYLSL